MDGGCRGLDRPWMEGSLMDEAWPARGVGS